MSYPLEIINLEKTYKDKKAVNNISFKVNQNEIIGILGPNGCGKTTTIGMILGLLKPSKGKILINGIEIEKRRVELLDKLNFISPYIELPKKLTVQQNLIVYGKMYEVEKILAASFNVNLPNELKIDFNEPEYPMTVQDQIALDTHRLNLGLINRAELMVEYNKDLSIQEASAKLQQNDLEQPQGNTNVQNNS